MVPEQETQILMMRSEYLAKLRHLYAARDRLQGEMARVQVRAGWSPHSL